MDRARVSYTFERCLGRGGYGEVYLANRTRPGGLTTRVAVKVLRSNLGKEAEALGRLRDEGRMLAMLDHPAILGVHEMTRIDGRVALVTEYVEGVDVARCCKRGFLMPHRVVVGVIGEVAAALHTASTTVSPETGKPLALIHRDIKPENIRVSKHGEVKLLDFGIARTTEIDREAHTVAGALPFTPGYAAPECFSEGVQSAASDVFALGATTFRMLAGERLFEGCDTIKQMMLAGSQQRFEDFLVKRFTKLDVDDALADLVRDMLAFDPDDRPAAAQVQHRCELLSDRLTGPTHVRWARSTEFGEPRSAPAGDLTGRTIFADHEQPQASDIETQRLQIPPPPPVPDDLSSVKPNTPPILSPLRLGPTEEPAEPRSQPPPRAEPPRSDPPPSSGPKTLEPMGSLPIPDAGLHTLPNGLRVAAPDVETKVLPRPRASGGGWLGLLVKIVVVLVLLGVVSGAVFGVVGLLLWYVLG